ncbi:hypothetical protein KXJ70_14590 [Zhongshania sp. CAU 1632]|uniref:Bulb-type lectin domain-containing protein n=2 Tax=Zhongshania aquimaris TaxID=2857107 RepID=A0ABS6VUK8_9GAMM|nr:hypothetical protein [Zhongshania aquimaris]
MKTRCFSFFSIFCLSLMSEATLAAPISQLDLFGQAILAHHNAKRAAHNAPAMVWDTQLAAEAQAWTDSAGDRINPVIHDTNRGLVGENLFFRTGSSTSIDQLTAQAVAAWYAELERYDFANPESNVANDIGHFSQVVWDTSTQLGCGASVFSQSHLSDSSGMIFLVCRYRQPGNFIGQFEQHVFPVVNQVAAVPSFSTQIITAPAASPAPTSTPTNSDLTTSSSDTSGLITSSSSSNITTSTSTPTSSTKDFNVASTQIIAPGTNLNKGQKFYSPNKKYFVVFQSDGNLAVFTASGKRVSGLESIKGLDYKQILLITLPADGNLTFLDKYKKPVFKASSFAKIAAKSRLVLSDDGQVLLMSSSNQVILKL